MALVTPAQSVLNCDDSVSPSGAEIEDSRSEVSPRGGKETLCASSRPRGRRGEELE